MQFPDAARTCQEGNFLVEYVQIKVKTITKRLNDVKRQTNYLVCNIEGTGTTVISIAQIDTIVLNEGYNLQVFYQNFLQIVILVKNID